MKKLPKIFYMSSKEIDFLASEMGISSDSQKMILNIILESKQDVLNYDDFVEEYSVRIRSLKGDLDSLFKKIYESKRGIITSRITEDGQVLPYKIIITDEASRDFYYYDIEVIFIKTYIGIDFFNTLLTVKSLDSNLLDFKNMFINIQNSDINSEFFSKEARSNNVLVWNSLIIPAAQADYLVNFSEKVFLVVASNNIVKDIVSRAKNLKIADYDKNLLNTNKDISLSLNILSSILENKDEIQNKKTLNLPKNWEVFLVFLNHFLNNKKTLKDLENTESMKMEESLNAIEKDLEGKEITVNIDEFNALLNKYSEQFAEPERFLDLSRKYFFDPSSKDILPKIFKVKDSVYLYKSLAYILFLKEFDNALVEVKKEIEFRVNKILDFSKNTSSIFTEEELNNTINQFLSNKYVLTPYFLNNKTAFLDIIVAHYKKIAKNQGIPIKEKVKTEIVKYFKNSNEFLPLHVIYNINLNDIFDSSFKNLNILKKLILFLTGKYQSYKEVLFRLNLRKASKSSSDGFFNLNKKMEDNMEERRIRKDQIKENVRASYLKEKQEKEILKQKNYSSKEQNDAWNKFGDKLNKKK